MIDLFGLRQKDASESVEPIDAAPQPMPADIPAPKGSHRLWALLLILDSIFVIVFSGAVAAKIYHHWESPSVSVPFVRHHPPKPVPVSPTVGSTVTVASKPPEPIKPPEPAKAPESDKPVKPEQAPPQQKAAVLKTVAGADTPRPPKPSMLTESPRPRTTPTPADVTSSPAAAPPQPSSTPAAGNKQKAVPVSFKITAPKASKVFLVGAFIVHGGRKEMSPEDGGVWSVKLYLNPGQYRYFFSVDKKKTLDPENPQSDRGASLLTVQ